MKMSKKYMVIGYVTQMYIIDAIEAESKSEVLKQLKLDGDKGIVIEEDQFDSFIKDKKRIGRKCEIDIGIFNKDKEMIEFNID